MTGAAVSEEGATYIPTLSTPAVRLLTASPLPKHMSPHHLGTSTVSKFLLNTQTSAYTRNCQPAHLLSLYSDPPSLRRPHSSQ